MSTDDTRLRELAEAREALTKWNEGDFFHAQGYPGMARVLGRALAALLAQVEQCETEG